MGNFSSSRYKVHVTTGDKKGAGTDAKVWIQLVDASGGVTEPSALNKLMILDHKRGHTMTFDVPAEGLKNPDNLDHVVIWRDSSGFGDAWFLEKIEVEDRVKKPRYVFPVNRWIEAAIRYDLYQYDAFLPQQDPQTSKRKTELEEKRRVYTYKQPILNGPKQLQSLPEDEQFSEIYAFDLAILKRKLVSEQHILELTTQRWETLNDIENLYSKPPSTFYRPDSVDRWMDDKWFGRQRVQGLNPVLLKLCKQIPDKLPVVSEMVEPFLQGKTLSEALSLNRIFIIDLEILDKIQPKEEALLVSPIALFFLDANDELTPICIQLYQEPGFDNPLYFPSDSHLTWTTAKMFFNMGESQHHQSVTHLGFTHLLMESMCVATNRHLSPSHPIYRLLAPHFFYLLAINKLAIEKLLDDGGWVDKATTVGVQGLFQLVARGFAQWRLDVYGSVVKEIESRGVLDPKILPDYPYRDDAVDIYNIVERYVSKVVNYYYDFPEKLRDDNEIQAWCREMASSQAEGGLGIGGVPDKMDSVGQLVQICTTIVSTCSIGHAAANFQQYDAYGYVPNYPELLRGLPPKQKREMTDQDILEFLPSKGTTLDIMVITKILSTKGTQSLGDFEVQYLYDPKVVVFADEFRLELKRLSLTIAERNKKRKYPYEWLDPKLVPNSISI